MMRPVEPAAFLRRTYLRGRAYAAWFLPWVLRALSYHGTKIVTAFTALLLLNLFWPFFVCDVLRVQRKKKDIEAYDMDKDMICKDNTFSVGPAVCGSSSNSSAGSNPSTGRKRSPATPITTTFAKRSPTTPIKTTFGKSGMVAEPASPGEAEWRRKFGLGPSRCARAIAVAWCPCCCLRAPLVVCCLCRLL